MSPFVLYADTGKMRVSVSGGDISCQAPLWLGSLHDTTAASLYSHSDLMCLIVFRGVLMTGMWGNKQMKKGCLLTPGKTKSYHEGNGMMLCMAQL